MACRVPRLPLLDRVWIAAVWLAVLLPFLPWSTPSTLVPAAWLGGYTADVAARIYVLIKAAFLWIPVGFLLSAAGMGDRVKAGALVLALLSLPAAWLLVPESRGLGTLELFFMLPGLALGLHLARYAAVPAIRPGVELTSAHAEIVAPERGNQPGRAPAAPVATSASRLLARLVAGALLGVTAIGLARFPILQLPLALGLALYLALLWRVPWAWVIVVPAALPLLDLAHWSGRFFWDEFDLLMLATVAAALWQGRVNLSPWAVPRLGVLLGLFALAALVSLMLGLLPLQPLDANAFSAYWSHYNALRVGKGLLWGLAFYTLYRAVPEAERPFTRLSIGMALGVLGVSLWALWEQWAFAGAATTADYRVTAGFSSMHTGGGHIEAYMVAALPFVWGLAFQRATRWLWRGLAGLVFLLGSYALFFTVARGGVVALGVALLILIQGTWRALRSRAGWRARLAMPVVLGLVTVGVMLAGVSGVFWKERLARTGADAGVRVQHWAEVLDLRRSGIVASLFGQGMGGLPEAMLASRLPAEAGHYRYVSRGGNTWLALNSAGDLYMAQRVAPRPGETLKLQISVRAPSGQGALQASLCEKILFNSRQCQWLDVPVKPGAQDWQPHALTFNTGDVGAGNVFMRRPVQFSLYNPAAGTVIEVDDVRLLDAAGHDLLRNGDFSSGGDFWLFKSGDHLFWHAKNLWVHILFEQGWLGASVLSLIMLLALVRLLRAATSARIEASVLLAALAALLVVGVVDSLIDAPRLALLVYGLLFMGAAWGASRQPSRAHRGPSRRHHALPQTRFSSASG